LGKEESVLGESGLEGNAFEGKYGVEEGDRSTEEK